MGQGAGKKLKPMNHKFKKEKEPTNASQAEEKEQKALKCFFCKKIGHMQKDCHKRKA